MGKMGDRMTIHNVNGGLHTITSNNVQDLLKFGWMVFLAAWVINIIFYLRHPSTVDFSLKRFEKVNKSNCCNSVNVEYLSVLHSQTRKNLVTPQNNYIKTHINA